MSNREITIWILLGFLLFHGPFFVLAWYTNSRLSFEILAALYGFFFMIIGVFLVGVCALTVIAKAIEAHKEREKEYGDGE